MSASKIRPILIERGDHKKIKLDDDGYGLSLHCMSNGFQWFGFRVDDDLLEMIEEVIRRYFDNQP